MIKRSLAKAVEALAIRGERENVSLLFTTNCAGEHDGIAVHFGSDECVRLSLCAAVPGSSELGPVLTQHNRVIGTALRKRPRTRDVRCVLGDTSARKNKDRGDGFDHAEL